MRIDEQIPTPTGWTTMGELRPGDLIFGADGNPTIVQWVSNVEKRECYQITFSNGERVVADADHEWLTFSRNERCALHRRGEEYRSKRRLLRPKRGVGKKDWLGEANSKRDYSYLPLPTGTVRTTKQMLDDGVLTGNQDWTNFSIRLATPLNLSEKSLHIDPYLLGCWLGDGNTNDGHITTADDSILNAFRDGGYEIVDYGKYHYCIHGFKVALRGAGILGFKHIPAEYLRASRNQRLELLKGLLDTDGTCCKNGAVEFCNTNRTLIDGVLELLHTLGYLVSAREGRAKLYGKDCGPKWTIKFFANEVLFKLERKARRQILRQREKWIYITDITSVGYHSVKCVSVANDSKLFLCSKSFIPTHNSYFTRVALICWSTWIPGLQSFIFRKYYDDVISNHMEGPDGFKAMLHDSVKNGSVKITESAVRWLNTGSLITLSHCATDEAVEKAQGVPKHVLVLEEAAQMLERHIRFLRSWVSMPEVMKDKLPDQLKAYLPWMEPNDIRELFPRVIYTGNPTGISMQYFRKNFVKAAPKGTIFRAPEREGGFRRQYIEARVEDNPSEDSKMVHARVKGLGDAALSSALLEANWDAPIGEFFPQYSDEVHTTSNFDPPDHWFKFLTFDWGLAEPFAVVWWCVSDGVEFAGYLGERKWFRRGALIAYREWYGCDPNDTNKGLEMRNEDVAHGINERTREPTSGLVISDAVPFVDRGMSRNGKKYVIADIFREHGCPLTQGNSARKFGWAQCRDRLIGVSNGPGIPNDPMVLFAECCVHLRDYVPSLGRHKTDPEDAQDRGEATHMCDCFRIACATKPIIRDEKKPASKDFKRPHIMTTRDILRALEKERMSCGRRY